MSEGRELTRLVILDGVAWPAGSVPPAGVAERIRNPKCWEPVESDPPLPWGPEGMPAVGTPTSLVIPATPASGITNLEEKAGDSAVVAAGTGSVIGRSEADHPLTEQVAEQDPPEDSPAPAGEPEATSTPQTLLSEPPRSGKGASTAAWLAYARQFDVDVPEGADRGEIIALLEDDGYIQ